MSSNGIKIFIIGFLFAIFIGFYFLSHSYLKLDNKIKYLEFDLTKSSGSLKEIESNINNISSSLKLLETNNVENLKKLSESVENIQKSYSPNSAQDLGKINKETIIQNSLKLYDLKKENKNEFECVKSAVILNTQTTICIHDPVKDVYVSKSIKNEGAWEASYVKLILEILSRDTNLQFIDIGANIGQFSLFAAKYGRNVISVEPFYDNYVRLHKAAQIEKTTDKITLVTNGLSDKQGQIKKLIENNFNVGGQFIIEMDFHANSTDLLNDKYYLTTIFMNDLTRILPVGFNEAVMKIDIEGHELKAFKKASELFDKVKIKAVLMEWTDKTNSNRFPAQEINQFLDFMYSRNFTCKNPNGLLVLKRENWPTWPGDIIWFHNGFQFSI